jgi:CHASE3 domain sensor protein
MRWSIGTKIASVFGVALTVLLGVGVVSHDSTANLIASADWVRHSHQVVTGLDEFLSAMKDGETGQRGYLITGEARYLAPYRGARELADQKLKQLRELTSDNPNEQQRITALEPLVAAKFSELQETIDLRRTRGFAAAEQVVVTDRGKNVMDSIRKLIADMDAEETNLLAQRSAEEKDRVRSTNFTILAGSLGSFVILGLAGVLLTRNIAVPLGELSAAARKIAAGDLSAQMALSSRRDEVGVLTETFQEMTISLGQMARVAEQISAGDLSVEVKPKSDRDVLGKAFAQMTLSLGQMAKVAEQISEGDLTVEVRAKSDKDTLGKAFAVMLDKLRRVTGEMQE